MPANDAPEAMDVRNSDNQLWPHEIDHSKVSHACKTTQATPASSLLTSKISPAEHLALVDQPSSRGINDDEGSHTCKFLEQPVCAAGKAASKKQAFTREAQRLVNDQVATGTIAKPTATTPSPSWMAGSKSNAEKATEQEDDLLRREYLNREEDDEREYFLLRADREKAKEDQSRDLSPIQLWRHSADWEDKLEARIRNRFPLKRHQEGSGQNKRMVIDNEQQNQFIAAIAAKDKAVERKIWESANTPPEQESQDQSTQPGRQQKDKFHQSRLSNNNDSATRALPSSDRGDGSSRNNSRGRRGGQERARGDFYKPSR